MNSIDAKDFCSCSDRRCPFNPANHAQGCSLCVNKCLRAGEIPSCFFNLVSTAEKPESYTIEGFARFVAKFRPQGRPLA